MKPRIPKNLPPRQKRARDGDSKAHLAFIRSLPCCVCGNGLTQAHHILRADDRPKGTGRRNHDKYALPICAFHHIAQFGHDTAHGSGNDEAWLQGHGIDGRALAAALWRVSGDLDAGLRIVERCKQVEAK